MGQCGAIEGMACSGLEAGGRVGAGLVGPHPGMTGLGEGQRWVPRSLGHCYHGNSHLSTTREPGKGWGEEFPDSGTQGEEEHSRPGGKAELDSAFNSLNLPISRISRA